MSNVSPAVSVLKRRVKKAGKRRRVLAGRKAIKINRPREKSGAPTFGDLHQMYAALCSYEVGEDISARWARRAAKEYDQGEIRLLLSKTARKIYCDPGVLATLERSVGRVSGVGKGSRWCDLKKLRHWVDESIGRGKASWVAVLMCALGWGNLSEFLNEVYIRASQCRDPVGNFRKKLLMVQVAIDEKGRVRPFAEILDAITTEHVMPPVVDGTESALSPGVILPFPREEEALRALWREMCKTPSKVRGQFDIHLFGYPDLAGYHADMWSEVEGYRRAEFGGDYRWVDVEPVAIPAGESKSPLPFVGVSSVELQGTPDRSPALRTGSRCQAALPA